MCHGFVLGPGDLEVVERNDASNSPEFAAITELKYVWMVVRGERDEHMYVSAHRPVGNNTKRMNVM